MQQLFDSLGYTVICVPLATHLDYCRRGRIIVLSEALSPAEIEEALVTVFRRIFGADAPISAMENTASACNDRGKSR